MLLIPGAGGGFCRTAVFTPAGVSGGNPEIMYVATVHSKKGFIRKTTNLSAGTGTKPPETEGHPCKLNVLNDEALVVGYSGRLKNDEFTASSGVFYSADGGNSWSDGSDAEIQALSH